MLCKPLLICLLLSTPTAPPKHALAQGAAQLTQAPSPITQTPRNLGEALGKTYWNPQQRGPLIALAPERVTRRITLGPGIPLPSPTAQGYNAQEITGFYDHAPMKVGGVTIIAPQTMRLFTRPKMSPEQALAQSKETASAELLASLTPDQWQLIGSENGLGLSDLSDKQRPYFQALLPTQATLVSRAPQPDDRPAPRTQLTETQLQSLRVRIAKQTHLSYLIEDRPNTEVNLNRENPPYQLVIANSFASDPAERNPLLAKLFPKVPNRRKPGELDFASSRLDTTISLMEVKTLGDLMKRIGTATKLTLASDYRLTSLPLWVRGESAKAGDLLQALCLGVCGTFRKMDEATFLLTEDVEGLTVRQAAYDQWQARVEELRSQRQEERNKQMRANGAVVATDNPYQLSPEVLKKAENFDRPLKAGEEKGIATSELPAALQRQIETTRKSFNSDPNHSSEGLMRGDRVRVLMYPRSEWVIPGIGAFDMRGSNLADLTAALRDPVPPADPAPANTPLLSPNWKERVVILAPQTPEEAKEAVARARKAGMTGVWIAVPLDRAKAKPLLEAALKEGKTQGIAVGMQVAALQSSPILQSSPGGTSPLDRTVLGTTSGFLLPPTGIVAQQAGTSVKALAQLPGLSAVLVKAISPSYLQNRFVPSYDVLGYSPENRAAFFQQTGVILTLGWTVFGLRNCNDFGSC